MATSSADIVAQAEELHGKKQFKEVFELLNNASTAHPDDVEITWRLARAYFDLAEDKPNDKAWKQDNFTKGLAVATKALEQHPNHFATHKWWAILTSQLGDFQGMKEKIGNAFKIKEHAMKAAELKPDDATVQHILGKWCFTVANIGWLERKAASALFASPPESTFDEALGYLLKAQELQANFLRNALLIGDTYAALKQPAKAKEWYQKTLSIPAECEADRVIHDEAKAKSAKL